MGTGAGIPVWVRGIDTGIVRGAGVPVCVWVRYGTNTRARGAGVRVRYRTSIVQHEPVPSTGDVTVREFLHLYQNA